MFAIYRNIWYHINMEKIYLRLKKKHFHMLDGISILCSTILSSATNYRKQLLEEWDRRRMQKMMYELAEASVEFIVLLRVTVK